MKETIITAKNPLAEVFGFPTSNMGSEAVRYRTNKLCPFNNKVPSCTKDKANAPLGVCSVFAQGNTVITCPVRFRQDWLIAEDAAHFFFPPETNWTSLAEVKLNDANGQSAGNIDLVLVSYDDRGKVLDFGSLEIQAVYISGNVRRPFEKYISNPATYANLNWANESGYPRPDFLSSSRKRLAPQLIYKGGILNHWNKKMAVALDRAFLNTLPELPEVDEKGATLAWFIYDLVLIPETNVYQLQKVDTKYTCFKTALDKITTPLPGKVDDFISVLQDKLDDKLDNNPPETVSLTDIVNL
jgi:hypothetical protein